MTALNEIQNFETSRQIYRALMMHYLEGLKQSDIAAKTGWSTAKVNRLIKQGKELGMVEISIKSPYQPLLDIEADLKAIGNLDEAIVAPAVSDNPDVLLQSVGGLAANYLLQNIKDGDIIAITGGKGVTALIEGLQPQRDYDVQVVPMTGCVQGKHYTDVNHVATSLAEKLGGKAWQIHAPLFAESIEERDMVMNMRAVSDVLDIARKANIAIFGIGSILSADSSYFDLHPLSAQDQEDIKAAGAVGELLGQLIAEDGSPINFDLNGKLVAITPEEMHTIPHRIGLASGNNKVIPMSSILRGNHFNALVTDEEAARGVLASVDKE